MRTLLTTTLAGIGLLLAACGVQVEDPNGGSADGERTEEASSTDDEGTADGQDDGSAAGAAADLELGEHCENPVDGYRIAYPASWHANDGEVTAACTVFDVAVPEIHANTVLPLASAVLIMVEDRDLDETREVITEDPAMDVGGFEDTQIEGRAALRVDGTATGEAYLDEGIEVHRTYVAFEGRTLVAAANELGDVDLDARRELIVDMLASLEPVASDGGEDETSDRDETTDRDEATSDAGEDAETAMIGEASRQARSGGDGRGYLVDVRTGDHDGFTRVTFEFDEELPAYEVAPTDEPIVAFPSGQDIEVAGEDHLEVVTSGTRVDLSGEQAVETYEGSLHFEVDGAPLVEVAMIGDHHGQMTWVLGLSEEADFAAVDLEDPARIVIDVVDG